MQRLGAYVSVLAMLFALAVAPLFHVHDEDHDGHAGSLVHAHLPEHVGVGHHSGSGVEAEPSDEHGRSINLFAVNIPVSVAHPAVAELSEPLALDTPILSRERAAVLTLRSHSPPENSGLPSRSPPIS